MSKKERIKKPKVRMRNQDSKERIRNFDEVPLGYTLEEAIAVGDSRVDIGMIKRAGLGIALKATDEVKKQADVVSDNLRIILEYI